MTKLLKTILWVIIVVIVVAFIWIGGANDKQSAGEVIKIGAVVPLTGKLASYGQKLKNGLDLALSDVNKKSLDYDIELIYEDTSSDPKKAVSASQKLINVDGVSALFSVSSSDTLAIAPIAETNKVILFTPIASAEGITNAGDYVFRNRESGSFHGIKLADFIKERFNDVAVLYSAPTDSAITYKDTFIEKFESLGGNISFVEGYGDESDFRTYITKLNTKDFGAILIAGTAKDIGLMVKQLREMGVEKQVFSVAGAQSPDLLEIAGDSANGLIYTVPYFNSNEPAISGYVSSYKEAYNEDSDVLAANSYDALNIINIGLQKCGSDTNCIKNELYKIKDYNGMGGLTTFDENGDVIKPVMFKTVEDGEFVEYKK